MIFLLRQGELAPTAVAFEAGWAPPADAVWLDLLNPTREEETSCEAFLGVLLPTREEMEEIETSSRLYKEDGATFMTAALLAKSLGEAPEIGPVTFVLTGERLATIRYLEPRAFQLFVAEANARKLACTNGAAVFLGLLEAITDRLADVLEHAVAEVEALSASVLRQPRKIDFRAVMRGLGANQALNAKVRESTASLTRLMIFATTAEQLASNPDGHERLGSLQRDLASLTDHASYLSGNITFLLNAALGMINVEQNGIIKFFSVAAVIFLPPTLVASYFGMNFEGMDEFRWEHGELMAAGLMVVSIVVPLWWFKRKGWL